MLEYAGRLSQPHVISVAEIISLSDLVQDE